MSNTEEKLRLENEVSALKREQKYALEKVTVLKQEVTDILSLKDKANAEIIVKKKELDKILEDISSEKLNWALERQSQMQEMSNKISEAENVIKRKSELNEQEEKLRIMEAKDTEIRNEARQLEFKNEQTRTNLLAEKKILEEKEKDLELLKNKLSKDRENFKKKVIEVLKEVELWKTS